MKPPPDLIYGVGDKPPLPVTLFNDVQHVGVIAMGLNLPFRIGVKKPVALKMAREAVGSANIRDFLRVSGAKRGAHAHIWYHFDH